MNKFMYNPIPLDENTRHLFPNLKTLYLYSSKDKRFEEDENIIARKEIKKYDMLYPHQYKALEEWTGLSCGDIIFDSTKHGWSKGNNEFMEKILNKSKVCIVIENGDGEIFGCYINSTINGVWEWIKDENAFVFNLESNGRHKGPMKFDIKKERCGGICVTYI